MSEQHFDTPMPVRVEVRIPSGEVEVASVEGHRSTVRLEGAQKVLDSVMVELVGDRLLVEQRRKAWINLFERGGASLQVYVQVPVGSSAELATASGDTRLNGVFGGIDVRSASGDLRADGEVDGDAHVKTASGDIRLGHVTGELDVRTVSGDVEADAVDGSVSVKSVSGDVRIASVREGSVSVQSVSGDVQLGVAAGTSIDVDAGSASGELSSEVSLSNQPGDPAERTVVIRSNTVSGDFRVVRAG
jgi:hypothetical protein